MECAARQLEGGAGHALARVAARARPAPGRSAIGSILQTGSSETSQPRSVGSWQRRRRVRRRASAPARRRRDGAGRPASRPGPATAVGMPGSKPISPTVPTPPSLAWRSPRPAAPPSAAARPASWRASIGVVPACEARPRDHEAEALDADAAAHRRRRDALGLEHGALLDVELEVGAEPLQPGAALEDALELDAVLGEHAPARGGPSASRAFASSAGSRVPAAAELPNRLRPKRAPSSSAQSTRASVRGGCAPSAPAQARSTPSAPITPSAPSSQPPSGTESRWEPTASAGSALARADTPRRCRPRRSPARGRSRRAAPAGSSRAAPPALAPAEPLGAVVVAGPPLRARAGRRSPASPASIAGTASLTPRAPGAALDPGSGHRRRPG